MRGSIWGSIATGLLLFSTASPAASPWMGDLRLEAVTSHADVGEPLTVNLSSSAKENPAVAANRGVSFFTAPYRHNLLADAWTPLHRSPIGNASHSLPTSSLQPGWHLLAAVMDDDRGNPQTPDQTLGSENREARGMAATTVIAIRSPSAGPFVRLHTEGSRSVYSTGEAARFFVSARGVSGVKGSFRVLLNRDPIAAGVLDVPPGREQTMAFDYEWPLYGPAPGSHALVLEFGGQEADRLPLRFVHPRRAGAKARYWAGLPFGNSSGYVSTPTDPSTTLRLTRWIMGAKESQNANFWVQVFAAGAPLVTPAPALPLADDPAMPPAAAEFRPSGTAAMHEKLLAEGIGFAVMMGGSELGSENYNPVPTIFPDQIALSARAYHAAAQSFAHLPNFTAAYTDVYAKPDWHGGSELTPEQAAAVRSETFKQAMAAAAASKEAPYDYVWESKALPKSIQVTGDARKKFDEAVKALVAARFGGDRKKLDQAPPAEQAAVWEEIWKSTGVTRAPEPARGFPLPRPRGIDLTPDQAYQYTEFVQSGLQRYYTKVTEFLARDLPALFTIHNKNRENHRIPFVYNWADFTRSPSIPPEYSRGTTVAAISEWNLDGDPQPYNLAGQIHQTLLDEGRPVWRVAAHRHNGGQARFLRDAIYNAGFGMTAFYENPGTATWSHQGADQSSYAALDRLAAVTRFLTAYEDLFDRLEPVREVGIYLRPGWGDDNARAFIAAMPAVMMAGYQAHVLTHADLAKGHHKRYRAIFAPALPAPFETTSEQRAFQEFTEGGGLLITSPAATSRYENQTDLARFGITKNAATDSKSPSFTETPEQRAALTKAVVLKDLPKGEVVPFDYAAYGPLVDGVRTPWPSHWTKMETWGNIQPVALEGHLPVKQALEKTFTPIVVKDRPEVFVQIRKPSDPTAKNLFLFVSNFTIPDEPEWTKPRIPWMFFPTYAKPCTVTLKVRADGLNAVHDLVSGRPLESRREGDRLVFQVDLREVEGRVLTLLPAPAASAALRDGRLELRDATGTALPAWTTVHQTLRRADGGLVHEAFHAAGSNLPLPNLPSAAGAGPLRATTTELLTGWTFASDHAPRSEPPAQVPAAPPVLVHRGDAIHPLLKSAGGEITVLVDSGTRDPKSTEVKITTPNPSLTRDLEWAGLLAKELTAAGLKATVRESKDAATGPLRANPWLGSAASYRGFHTVPDIFVPGTVVLVGSPTDTPLVVQLDESSVAPRSLQPGNTGGPNAVVAFLPRAFSPDADSVLVAARTTEGVKNAATALAALLKEKPAPDRFLTRREESRAAWLPADVARFKRIIVPPNTGPPPSGEGSRGSAPDFSQELGPRIFALSASDGGVAVSLSSIDRSVALVSPDGKVVLRTGRVPEVWARDIGVSADGKTLVAGFALGARVTAYQADGKPAWTTPSAVISKDQPNAWDTFKDSERFLAVSPDGTKVLVYAGKDGYQMREIASGRELWRYPVDFDEASGRAPTSEQISFSPDGQVAVIFPSKKGSVPEVEEGGGEGEKSSTGNVPGEGAYVKTCVLVDTTTGKAKWTGPGSASGWELYSAVGPRGLWTITATRGSPFALRDEEGTVLRVFQADHLPEGVREDRGQIPPLFLTGNVPDRFLLSKAETRALYVMKLQLGTPAQRAAARKAEEENQAALTALLAEVQDRKNHGKWTAAYVDAFMTNLTAPAEAKKLVGDKMKRFPGEAKAGRRRDFRFIAGEIEDFKRLQFEEDRAIMEAAAGLGQEREIPLPHILAGATAEPALDRAYVALWDGTVRAYDVASGKELWKALVRGGSQLALHGDALYAGGSRGDLTRLDPATGRILWTLNFATTP